MNNIVQKPLLIAVSFSQVPEFSFELRLRGNNDQALSLTVVHEYCTNVDAYELAGNEASDNLLVSDGDTLTIIARIDQAIIACGVFEINTNLPEQIDVILSPLVSHNILIDQFSAPIVCEVVSERVELMEVAR